MYKTSCLTGLQNQFRFVFRTGSKVTIAMVAPWALQPPTHTEIQTTLRHKFPVPVSIHGLPNSTSQKLSQASLQNKLTIKKSDFLTVEDSSCHLDHCTRNY